MTTSSSRQPGPPYPKNSKLLKGALISLDASTKKSTTVPFQYNPATLSRSLKVNQLGGTDLSRSTELRFTGAAMEIIRLEAHLVAVDGEATGQAPEGLLPQLAALELFAYPSTGEVTTYQNLLAGGAVNIVPPLAPRLIFVWGPHRVLPVRLQAIEISEQMFDPQLNPITATVSLEMRTLTYSDVTPGSGDYSLFFAHQKNLESRAATISQGRASQVVGVNVANPSETA